MERYKNLTGDSGVHSFEIGVDYIIVQFNQGRPYTYTYRSAGGNNIEQMKAFAKAGRGLGTFINKYVRNKYEG
jgi:hypothetical protein